MNYTIRELKTKKDIQEAYEILLLAFDSPVYAENSLSAVWSKLDSCSIHTKIITIDDKVVSIAVIGLRVIRFPPAKVQAATIGPVATHPDYQRMGLSTIMLNYIDEYLKSLDITVAYLQGIPNYYNKFHYFPYMAKSKIIINTDDISNEIKGNLEPIREEHFDTLKSIYNNKTSNIICSSDRSDVEWEWLFYKAVSSYYFFQPKVIMYNDIIYGYVTFDPSETFNIRELVTLDTTESYRISLGSLRAEARKLNIDKFDIKLPWDDGLCCYIRCHLRAEFISYCQPRGGSIMKILNYYEFFNSTKDFFQKKVAGIIKKIIDFSLMIDNVVVSIHIKDNNILFSKQKLKEFVTIKKEVLPGLITGYYSFSDIIPFLENNLTQEMVDAACNIFPRDFPFVYQGDNF